MADTLSSTALVALGGAVGAGLRYLFVSVVDAHFLATFSVGTAVVNVIGCFLAGICAGLFSGALYDADSALKALLITGFLGGFTTFSAFSLDVLKLIQAQSLLSVLVVAALHVIGSVVAVLVGFKAASLYTLS
jgi:CrcB protein